MAEEPELTLRPGCNHKPKFPPRRRKRMCLNSSNIVIVFHASASRPRRNVQGVRLVRCDLTDASRSDNPWIELHGRESFAYNVRN